MGLFSRKHDGMPDVDQGDGWTKSQWRRAPKKRVRVSDLESTNRGGYLNPRKAAEYAARGGGGDPYVVEHRGRYYIADGHHRVAGAAARGDKTITARVKRI